MEPLISWLQHVKKYYYYCDTQNDCLMLLHSLIKLYQIIILYPLILRERLTQHKIKSNTSFIIRTREEMRGANLKLLWSFI
jgi:hypothetical protein